MDSTPHSFRCAKPHSTNHSTDRYTASQLVWNVRAVSRQLNRRAQRAKNPIMAQVTGRFPSLHGMCSTTTPCSAHATRRGGCRARSRSRAHSVERWEASRDLRHDGVLSTLGATAELAGNGANVPDQLGSGVSVGGMVCRVGLGAPGTARGRIHRGGRDSLGTRLAGRQLSDRHLPNRRALPALAVGGTAALASHAAAGPEGTGAGGCQRAAICVQRHVEALLASHHGPGGSGIARAGPIPYHEPFESGGGSGAPSPTRQTIPPTDTPLPNWSGTFAPFPANSTVAPSALRPPSWRRSRDASHRSTECARLRLRARHTPRGVERSRNGLGFPTGAQIASVAGASGHSPALVADNANSARGSRHAAPG